MNKLKEKLKITKEQESLTSTFGDVVLGKSLNILSLEYDLCLNKFTHSDLCKVKAYLTEVIQISIYLEKEKDYTANCDCCIDFSLEQCLSGYGYALYSQNLDYVTKVIEESFTRGFEYVDVEHRKNEELTDLPQRGTSKSAGYDFKSPIDCVIKPNEIVFIWSDVKAYMMDDEELLIFPRSSMGKHKVKLANTIAKIDADYYSNEATDGNIGLMIENAGTEDFIISKGDRVCQGSFSKYLTTDDDSPVSDVRTGGLGSTGK